jgi:hypothetical protein
MIRTFLNFVEEKDVTFLEKSNQIGQAEARTWDQALKDYENREAEKNKEFRAAKAQHEREREKAKAKERQVKK